MDTLIAVLQSKRAWMFFAGLIVACAQGLFGITLDANHVFGVLMLIAAFIHGESIRPIQRKDKGSSTWPPKIFRPSAMLIGLAVLGLATGCCGSKPTPKPTPTPAPQPLTLIETATQSQLQLTAAGYADALQIVAGEIRSGAIKTNEQMRGRLVSLTHDARVAAEAPVNDEMTDHLPQDESGQWPDPDEVAGYLEKLSLGYRRVEGRLK